MPDLRPPVAGRLRLLSDVYFHDISAFSQQRFYVAHMATVAAKRAKAAIRQDRRANAQRLALEAKEAFSRGDPRGAYKLISVLAPKGKASAVSIRLDGELCWSARQELSAREQALGKIYGATRVGLHLPDPGAPEDILTEQGLMQRFGVSSRRPVLTSASNCADDLDDYDVFTPSMIESMINQMPNFKAGLSISAARPGGPLRGAVSELFKLASEIIAEPLAELSTGMGALVSFPASFRDGEMASLRKPGKGDGSDPENDYRYLSLLSHWGKQLLKTFLEPAMLDFASALLPVQFGGLPWRSTRDAIGIVKEIINRVTCAANKRRSHARSRWILVQALFDLGKAFDNVDREMLWDTLASMSDRVRLRLLLEEAHNGTYILLKDTRTGRVVRRLSVHQGVRQGSVEGPICFVILHDVSLRLIQGARGEDNYQFVAKLSPQLDNFLGLSSDCVDIKVGETVFMDDLSAMELFPDFACVNAFLTLIAQVLVEQRYVVNYSKLEVTARCFGAGAKAFNRKVKKGQLFVQVEGVRITVREHAKYLGSRTAISGTPTVEAKARVKSASTAHHRLSARFWKCHAFDLQAKVALWVALVRSILMYALEAKFWSTAALLRLERFQTRCLRHLARLPAHLTRVRSETVREKCNAPTVESSLRLRRLQWIRKVVSPVFRDDDNNPLFGTLEYDPAVAVRAAFFGRFEFEGRRVEGQMTVRQRIVLSDLQLVHDRGDDALRGLAQGLGVDRGLDQLTVSWLEWLARIPIDSINVVLAFASTLVEDPPEPHTPCPECGVLCRGPRGLSVHLARKHKLVESFPLGQLQCPQCHKSFTRRDTLIRHFRRTQWPLFRLPPMLLTALPAALISARAWVWHPPTHLPLAPASDVVMFEAISSPPRKTAKIEGGGAAAAAAGRQQVPDFPGQKDRKGSEKAKGKDAGKAKRVDEGNRAKELRLLEALSRLTISLDDERAQKMRDENVVLTGPVEHPLMAEMAVMVERYQEAGTTARKAAYEAGEDYKGHPYGKKPTAMLNSLMFRLSNHMEKHREAVLARVEGEQGAEARAAADKALSWLKHVGGSAERAPIAAARCFTVRTEDPDGIEDTAYCKWIFAANRAPLFLEMWGIFQAFSLLRELGLTVGEDHGPRSKYAKEVSKIAFGVKGKGKGRGALFLAKK
ncbi:unnamed protein product [Prorocentrum cordatum]|uniref:C2H2-type domain-containing protein n=1 Tax=Prorocentrum cordatum TaxID=2364126 RepID=A0ABN9T5E3_9DINO|nr:unnamed protein product [Polarella glacialis]